MSNKKESIALALINKLFDEYNRLPYSNKYIAK